jgi:hypothetical protein
MKVKFNFETITVNYQDAKFFVKEMDLAELSIKHSKFKMVEGKAVVDTDMVSAINDFCSNSVTGWENVYNEKNELMQFDRSLIVKLPFAVKQSIYNEVAKKAEINGEEQGF